MSGEKPFSPQEEEWFNKGSADAKENAPDTEATDEKTESDDKDDAVDEENWFQKAA